jgi:hypothetical protein
MPKLLIDWWGGLNNYVFSVRIFTRTPKYTPNYANVLLIILCVFILYYILILMSN